MKPPEEAIENIHLSFRAQDYNPYPFIGIGWTKEFEEDDLEGTLGDPESSDYRLTWMKDDWNGAMHRLMKFAMNNHGWSEPGEWRIDPVMYEDMDIPEKPPYKFDAKEMEWDKDYVLHEYSFFPPSVEHWVQNHFGTFIDLCHDFHEAANDPDLETVTFHGLVEADFGGYDERDLNELPNDLRENCLYPSDSFETTWDGDKVDVIAYQHPIYSKLKQSEKEYFDGDFRFFIGKIVPNWKTGRDVTKRLSDEVKIYKRRPNAGYGLEPLGTYDDETFRQMLKDQIGYAEHELEYADG